MRPASRFPAGLTPAAAQVTSGAALPPSALRSSHPHADGSVADATYVQPQPTPLEPQKQQLGERLFPLVLAIAPQLAGKITGMLLELDNSELLPLLETPEALNASIEEALSVLRVGGKEVWVEDVRPLLASRVRLPAGEGSLENPSCDPPPVSLTRGRTPSPPNEHATGPPLLPTSVVAPLPSDPADDRLIDDSSVVLNAHKPPGKSKIARPLLSRVQKAKILANQPTSPPLSQQLQANRWLLTPEGYRRSTPAMVAVLTRKAAKSTPPSHLAMALRPALRGIRPPCPQAPHSS